MPNIMVKFLFMAGLSFLLMMGAASAQPYVGSVPQSLVGAVGGVATYAAALNAATLAGAAIPTTSIGISVPPMPTSLPGVAAAGTNQATATPLTSDNSVVNSGTGGVLLAVISGRPALRVVNGLSVPVLVYPPTGGTINTSAANVAVQIVGGGSAIFLWLSTNTWSGS